MVFLPISTAELPRSPCRRQKNEIHWKGSRQQTLKSRVRPCRATDHGDLGPGGGGGGGAAKAGRTSPVSNDAQTHEEGGKAYRADVHELLGAHIVRVHNEGAVILLEVAAQLRIVLQAAGTS